MKPIISTLALVLPLFGCNPAPREAGTTLVREFIRNSWDAVVRFNPNDSLTLIGLPYPYTVPCVAGTFQELYYWDTYFTCEGLAADGRTELAKNNVDDMLYLVDRFGYMPNGSRTWYLNRSQPPYLAMAVDRIFRATGDREWLARALGTLEREYAFWMTERMTPIGLNRYSSSADEALVREFVVSEQISRTAACPKRSCPGSARTSPPRPSRAGTSIPGSTAVARISARSTSMPISTVTNGCLRGSPP